MKSIEQRLSRVEDQLSFYRRIAMLACVFAGFAILAGMKDGRDETVRAQRFVLLDEKGYERGVWKLDNVGQRLELRSADGKRMAFLAVEEGPRQITMVGAEGQRNNNRVWLQVMKDHSDGQGHGFLTVGSNEKKVELVAGDQISPQLLIMRDGVSRVSAVAEINRSTIAVNMGEKEKRLEVQ